MHISPALDRFLRGMEYPATRDDLIREAAREGVDAEDRALLAQLPEQSFSAAWHIRGRIALRTVGEGLTAPASAPLVAA